MHQANIATSAQIETPFETMGGKAPLPPCKLTRTYGSLCIPMPHLQSQVFSKYVSRLHYDGSRSEVGQLGAPWRNIIS
jgi:hypothetical protein